MRFTAASSLRLFNAHYDEYGFQPIVVFDGEGRFITAVFALPPGGQAERRSRPFSAACSAPFAPTGPGPRFWCAATASYCAPRVLDFCRANGLDYILGVTPTSTLRRHIEGLEAATRRSTRPRRRTARRAGSGFTTGPRVGAASARHRPHRGRRARSGHALRRHQSATTQRPSALRGCLLPARSGRNHIKSWKTHLAADRTSCTKASANQLRLFLHAGAYWIMWGLRVSMPKRSMWRVAQFQMLRLRLIKIAARVVELKTMIRVHLPTSCPAQHIFHYALWQIPRLEIPRFVR